MPIITGKRQGPYEILSSIGAGGMGEVYRASDTRLDRIVAIKILPDHLADRVELRERIEGEKAVTRDWCLAQSVAQAGDEQGKIGEVCGARPRDE